MPISDADAKAILRAQGMCGRVADGRACILPRHHDDNQHERGWFVVRREDDAPYGRGRDAREVIVTYRVCEHGGDRLFDTDNQSHAEWLARVLTRLDLDPRVVER